MKKYFITVFIVIAIIGGAFIVRNIWCNNVDELFKANLEALSQNEDYNPHYNNAKYVYCDNSDRMGCKGQLFRNCEGPFCN